MRVKPWVIRAARLLRQREPARVVELEMLMGVARSLVRGLVRGIVGMGVRGVMGMGVRGVLSEGLKGVGVWTLMRSAVRG